MSHDEILVLSMVRIPSSNALSLTVSVLLGTMGSSIADAGNANNPGITVSDHSDLGSHKCS